MAINAQELQGQWNKLRGQVKERWGQLTDDDLQIQGGNVDQLVGRIQQRTGEGREAIEKFLTEATSQGATAISQAAGQVGQYARVAGDQMREGYNRISDQFGRGYEYSQDMIRENPGRSVATAFGVGILLGVVVGMALRSR
jgi:uncharacterized protein YjbJ (UPF0337 family)